MPLVQPRKWFVSEPEGCSQARISCFYRSPRGGAVADKVHMVPFFSLPFVGVFQATIGGLTGSFFREREDIPSWPSLVRSAPSCERDFAKRLGNAQPSETMWMFRSGISGTAWNRRTAI